MDERLTGEQAGEQLDAIVNSDRVDTSVRGAIRNMVGLDHWPPTNPRECALELLDGQDGNPWLGSEVSDAAAFAMATILLKYQSYLDFQAGAHTKS